MRWNENTATLETVFYYKLTGGVETGDTWVSDFILSSFSRKDNIWWTLDAPNDVYEIPPLTGNFSLPSNTTPAPKSTIGFSTARPAILTAGGTFYFMDIEGTVDSGEVIAASGISIQMLLRMQNGNTYAFVTNSGTGNYEIWARDEPIDPPGNRLWIYKSIDNGITWTSQGVYTA